MKEGIDVGRAGRKDGLDKGNSRAIPWLRTGGPKWKENVRQAVVKKI